jgi:hypothetical protein
MSDQEWVDDLTDEDIKRFNLLGLIGFYIFLTRRPSDDQ